MRAEAQRHHAPSRRAPQLLLDEPFGCGEAAVGVRGRLVPGLGDRADQALRVVGDRDRRAVGSRQAGEIPAGVVAGRDPVAVGVLLVVERAVRVEGDDRAVCLDELVCAAVSVSVPYSPGAGV